MRILFLAGLVLAAGGLRAAGEADPETRLLRFPATNGEAIVFSYAGQLYTVAPGGGIARRLTSGPGYAIFPRFSPDGRQLAFTAQYDGNTEVYVMPSGGGAPKRLTYTATLARDDLGDRMGPNNLTLTWTHRDPGVVFRSRMRSFNDFIGQLYVAPLSGDLPRQLPVPEGGFASFSPDDSRMAYNRVFREFRTWKKYRGGMADDIWIFDFKTGKTENITNDPAVDIIPMWGPDNRIYFLSDRDGRMNLFSYDLGSKATRQLTHYRDFDIKFPSIGPDAIVYEEAGYLWRFDLKAQTARRVPVRVEEDSAIDRPELTAVGSFVTEAHPAPDGHRAIVVARGDLFSVPAEHGAPRNLTDTAGVHERGATWSPDGRWIAYLSDATGENELYIRPQTGPGAPVQLTQGATTYYYTPTWSPDGGKLLWGDRGQRLRYVDLATKEVTEVTTDAQQEIRQYVWSPDSRWIAFTRERNVGEGGVYLYSLASRQVTRATDPGYEADSPAFSDDGRFLLFASSRDFHPLYGDTEFNSLYVNMQRVYLLALARDTASPFAPKSDEVGEEDKPAEKKPEGKAPPPAVAVDLDGLSERVIGLPIAPAGYAHLRMAGDKIYYYRTLARPQDAAGPAAGVAAVYDLKERKETELGACEDFEVTRDGKKALVRVGKDYGFIDLPVTKIELKQKLDLADLRMHLDRAAEWRQIYFESWRQMRDFFYDPNMHGIDWAGMRDKYAALLPDVRYRYDLNYLIGELIGELQVGHAYVEGGDNFAAPRVPLGLLGAEFSRDPQSRAYRIDRILPGENWNPKLRSPLTELALGVKAGDFVLAVNGVPVRLLPNLYAGLIGEAGKQVILRVNRTPAEAGARDITVVPIADEAPLYYLAWIRRNEEIVSARSQGRVGYVHIPDMGPEGLNEFAEHYYPQLAKKALIIDDRGNGGGNVSPMIIERLRRQLTMIGISRGGQPTPNPSQTMVGPLVLLQNEYSASDGDLFPFRFRFFHLGTLIGRRTWGGAVGIRQSLPFSDGGTFRKPEFASYTVDGKAWVVEGHGIDPDIVVDNDPSLEFHGTDQQLEKAIGVILEQLESGEVHLPPPPAYPHKR